MIRGTTPTFVLTIHDNTIDLEQAESVYVTICQPGITITKKDEDLNITLRTVECYLTQLESLKLLPENITEIQINWTYLDDANVLRRAATEVKAVNIGRQLLPEVLT